MLTERFSLFILIYALAFAVFLILPPLAGELIGPYPIPVTPHKAAAVRDVPAPGSQRAAPGQHRFLIGEMLGLFTSPVLITLYWLLHRAPSVRTATRVEDLLFVAVSATWAAGQGIYLASQSIQRLLNDTETDVYALTSFHADFLGRYLWHFGVVALSTLLLFRAWSDARPSARPGAVIWPAAAIYGLTFFVSVIEGLTIPLGLPYAAAVAASGLVRRRKQLAFNPLLAFFVRSYALATVLFVAWGVYWGGFPEFSKLQIADWRAGP